MPLNNEESLQNQEMRLLCRAWYSTSQLSVSLKLPSRSFHMKPLEVWNGGTIYNGNSTKKTPNSNAAMEKPWKHTLSKMINFQSETLPAFAKM